MRYKKFKNANVEISELAVGTWAIGGEQWGTVEKGDSIEAILKMIENGVNIIDTAPAYAQGKAERIVGEAVEGMRKKIYISTKCGITNPDGKGVRNDAGYDTIMKECEESLKNLRTDYIDFYIIHWPDPNTPIQETMRAMSDLKKQGKIRFIGVSNFDRAQIQEAQQYGGIDVCQLPFSMVNQSQKELMLWADSQGIANMTYGSLGAGILTGAIREMPDFAEDDFRLTFYDFFSQQKFPKIMELLKMMDRISEKHHRPLAQIAINWNTQKSFVGTALTGVRNICEADENCATFDWKLSEEEMALIDSEIERLQINQMKVKNYAEKKS